MMGISPIGKLLLRNRLNKVHIDKLIEDNLHRVQMNKFKLNKCLRFQK